MAGIIRMPKAYTSSNYAVANAVRLLLLENGFEIFEILK